MEDGIRAWLDDLIAYGHAVDDDERIGVTEDRARAADAELRATTRRPRVGRHRRAGDLRLQRILERWCRRAVEIFACDDGDVVRRVGAGDARHGARDHLRLELQHVALERRAHLCLLRGERDVLLSIADAPDTNRLRTGGHGDGKSAVLARVRADGRADDRDRGGNDGLSRAGLGDHAGDTSLSGGGVGANHERQAAYCEGKSSHKSSSHECLRPSSVLP